MKYEEIEKKLKAVNLGKTYLYALMTDKFDFYSSDNMVIFFANKLDAMVTKILHGQQDYKIVKFDDLAKFVKELMYKHMEDGKIKPGVILGYITSSINGKPTFAVGSSRTPCFHAVGVSVEQVKGGFDLNNYLMEYIIDDDMDEDKVVTQLIFSNLCTDSKLEEAANLVIEAAKKDGLQTDKNISIRHIFAYEDARDLKTIWDM